jgi:hypothetical protein
MFNKPSSRAVYAIYAGCVKWFFYFFCFEYKFDPREDFQHHLPSKHAPFFPHFHGKLGLSFKDPRVLGVGKAIPFFPPAAPGNIRVTIKRLLATRAQQAHLSPRKDTGTV